MSQYNFAVDISNFIKEAIDDADELVKRVVAKTAFELVEESPIGDPSKWKTKKVPPGYTPGHFLKNWRLGVNSAPTGEVEGEDADRANALIRIGAKIPKNAADKTYYLVNNASYAQLLEDGWSGQAPEGWVEKVSMRFDSIVDHAITGMKK
jgi:hypothetical protein